MDTATVTVHAAATLIADQASHVASMFVLVQNNSGQDVYLGKADVAVGAGYKLATSKETTLLLFNGDKLYGIAASDADVNVISTFAENVQPFMRTLNAGGEVVGAVATPVSSTDAANKAYADTGDAAAEAYALAKAQAAQTRFHMVTVAGAAAAADILVAGILTTSTLVFCGAVRDAASPVTSETAHTTVPADGKIHISDDTTGASLIVAWFDAVA